MQYNGAIYNRKGSVVTIRDYFIAGLLFLVAVGDQARGSMTIVVAAVIIIFNLRNIISTLMRVRIVVQPLPGEEVVPVMIEAALPQLPDGIPTKIDGWPVVMRDGAVCVQYEHQITKAPQYMSYKRYLASRIRQNNEWRSEYERLAEEYRHVQNPNGVQEHTRT